MQDEILDVVDADDQVVGQKSRWEVYRENSRNFRVINVFLVNYQRKLWIPRRSPQKRLFPSCLDVSIGGHVKSGESYEDALRRELQEELNLDIDRVSCRVLGHLKPHEHDVSAFMKVYEIRSAAPPDYNPNDFSEAFWLTPEEVLERIEGGDRAKEDLPKLVRMFYPE